MARVGYVSRTSGPHDRRWVAVLTGAGHEVVPLALQPSDGFAAWRTPADLSAAAEAEALELFVAGPLTDAAAAAVQVLPTVGIGWAFDLLLESAEPEARAALSVALPRLARLYLDSQHLAELAVSLGAERARIDVAPWGIDVSRFAPGPSSAPVPRSAHVVFSMRSWEPMYDVLTVVRAFGRVLAADPAAVLVLAGDGSQAGAVADEIDRLGVGGSVRLVGRLGPDAVLDWLRRADVYVSAARSDGTSLSLLEALAVGVAPVVTNLPSNREWLTDDGLGRVFPAGDDAALAAAVLSVLRSPDPALAARRRSLVLARGDARVTQAVLLGAVESVLASVS